jgi:hypothetical protein
MAGLDSKTPMPTRIVAHQASRLLELEFDDGAVFKLPFELLRVYSPSAEVRGHGPGQEVLQVGKRDVGIDAVEPVGHYAILPRFNDGHATGIFSWDMLYALGRDQAERWADYLARLEAAGASRDPDLAPPAASAAEAGACGSAKSGISSAPAAAAAPVVSKAPAAAPAAPAAAAVVSNAAGAAVPAAAAPTAMKSTALTRPRTP